MENSHAAMYADDTNITVRSSSLIHVEEALNSEVENIHASLASFKQINLNFKCRKNRIYDHWNTSKVE
jgi:hypothetical protein